MASTANEFNGYPFASGRRAWWEYSSCLVVLATICFVSMGLVNAFHIGPSERSAPHPRPSMLNELKGKSFSDARRADGSLLAAIASPNFALVFTARPHFGVCRWALTLPQRQRVVATDHACNGSFARRTPPVRATGRRAWHPRFRTQHRSPTRLTERNQYHDTPLAVTSASVHPKRFLSPLVDFVNRGRVTPIISTKAAGPQQASIEGSTKQGSGIRSTLDSVPNIMTLIVKNTELTPPVVQAFGSDIRQYEFVAMWGNSQTRYRIVDGSRACLVLIDHGRPSARLASYWSKTNPTNSAPGSTQPTPSTISVFDVNCNGTADRIQFDAMAFVPTRPDQARERFNRMVHHEIGDILRASDDLLSTLSIVEPFRSSAFGHAPLSRAAP